MKLRNHDRPRSTRSINDAEENSESETEEIEKRAKAKKINKKTSSLVECISVKHKITDLKHLLVLLNECIVRIALNDIINLGKEVAINDVKY